MNHPYQRGDKVTIIGPSVSGDDSRKGKAVMVRGMTSSGTVAVRRRQGDYSQSAWCYPIASVKPYQTPRGRRRKASEAKKKIIAQIDAMLSPHQEKNPKLEKAETALKRWQSKLKRATTMVKKFTKQINYYRKKASAS